MPTNQEWLHKLANESPDELKAWFDAEHFECPSDAGEAAIMSVDAFIAEHNDNLADEKVVSGDAAHSNDANVHLKDSENLSDGFTDSREKLEADVYNHIAISITPNKEDDGVLAPYTTVLEWLDRQAAISEREHPGLTISDDESLINWRGKNYLLQSRVLNAERERDEFSLKLKHEMELNRDNRNALDLERIAELQAEIDRLQRRNDELRTSYDKLKCERDNLADDLLACNREREQLRKHLGIALDHAHDICTLVDIDGNVLDVGD